MGANNGDNLTYQSVVSKIAEWFWKKVDGLQLDADQKAIGVPQLPGLGASALMSEGICPRGKNHTLIPLSSQSTGSETVSELTGLRAIEERTGIDTAPDIIEARTKRLSGGVTNTTALILSRGSVAIGLADECTRQERAQTVGRDRAAWIRMHCGLVLCGSEK
jgi:hypothetical protein